MTKTEYDAARKLFERPVQEEDVLKEIMVRLQYAKISVFRIRENLPTGYRMSDPGIPDLHGRVPRGASRYVIQEVPVDETKSCLDVTSFSRKKVEVLTILMMPLPFYIEVKRPGEMDKFNRGVLKPKRMRTIYKQREFLDAARSDGCIAFFAESWHDVVVEFKEQGGIILPE